MPLRVALTVVVALVVIAAVPVCAQTVPAAITYQGRLTNPEGSPLPDDKYMAVFCMYESEIEEKPFWMRQTEIITSRGLFTVVLDGLEPGILAGRKEVWLEVAVSQQKPLPRIKLTSVPFALRAGAIDLPFAAIISDSAPAISITNTGGPALQATGNVMLKDKLGIGTASPQFPLDVNGIIRSSAGGFQFPDGSVQAKAGVTGNGVSGYLPSWGTGNTLGQSRLFQNASGNIGIGSTDPRAQLTVNSNITNVFPMLPGITVGNPNGGSGLWLGQDPSNYACLVWTDWVTPACAALESTGALALQSDSLSGKMGVGTYTPDEKLTVKGNVKIDCANENNGDLAKGAIKFGAGGTGEGIASKRTSGGNTNGLDFYTNSTSRLSITNGGNVGIGTLSPGYKLHVNGAVAGTGAYINLSDARFKTNIRPLAGALETVMEMRGVSFDWKKAENPSMDLEEGTQIGFIAQEIEKVLPEVVRVDPSTGARSVAYSEVIPVLVEAIKQQQEAIGELKSEKDAQIADLQRQIDEVKQMLLASKESK